MRAGIFSDIHSNLEAFEAVLSAMGRERLDAYFCVGDLVGYGADPGACLARVRGLSALTIAGNHDQAVCGTIGTGAFNPFARAAVEENRRRLGAAETAFLSSLRLTYASGCCSFVHGTLDEPAVFAYLLTEEDAERSFRYLETEFCFVGHTHEAAVFAKEGAAPCRRLPGNEAVRAEATRYIVNVGSVGQPRDGDPRASYCVFDDAEGSARIRRVPYDVEKARRKIIDAGLPGFLGDRLLYGQ